MNEKLFKKLNESVELASIRNKVEISKADETKLIFGESSFKGLLDEASYWLANQNSEKWKKFANGEMLDKNPEERKESKTQRELQAEYNKNLKEINDDFESEFDNLQRMFKKAKSEKKLDLVIDDIIEELEDLIETTEEEVNHLYSKEEFKGLKRTLHLRSVFHAKEVLKDIKHAKYEF